MYLGKRPITYTHKAFSSYLLDIRWEYDRNLLTPTALQITETAFNAGFGSLPYFDLALKNLY